MECLWISGGLQDFQIDAHNRVIGYDPVTGFEGTICSNSWDDMDADVLCRQIGFSGGTATFVARNTSFARGIFDIDCTGSESNLTSCQAVYYDQSGTCRYLPDAGAICHTSVNSTNGTGMVLGDINASPGRRTVTKRNRYCFKKLLHQQPWLFQTEKKSL